MKNVKLKICGMKYPENIQDISTLHPDYLGFIFWEKSSRYMNLETIPEIPKSIKKVGVFVNSSIQEIISKVKQYELDVVQLHGNESASFCTEIKHLNVEIIKVFSIGTNFDFSVLEKFLPMVDYFLFDTKGKLPGGNGVTFDWNLLEKYPFDKPFFLSGGIGINEWEAIKAFQKTKVAEKCIAIDVNSQFETKPGLKNKIELEKFKKLLYEI
ncbi:MULTISPECIES: phosphoribosylanthranilate isomerase [unclassified Flavobacterium]|uniref:phosphoribosylanthranilate isomerase n=1 Tax=unclassified Flavobacterium TaxID=196869 RepID=UPI0012908DE4|nr:MULTISPECIES: phosphoribosylanthranilate isomerase [unclassified Flavobacterium]MQP53211.1 phosphoribosylanthranilate isomerase [Flavobacterium sp. LMO9]MQP62958.1 phosphoribosylanthranilate isomerase [Flavobacterium sp. LMO6]